MNLDHNLAAQSALRDMADSAEKIEAAWQRLESSEIIRLAEPRMELEQLAERFHMLAGRRRHGHQFAMQSGMVPGVGYSAPIFMSELGWCQIIAREMLNHFEAMYRLLDAQKGGGS